MSSRRTGRGPPQSDLNNLLAGYADGDEASRRPGQD
jgi:hypothetical protein